MEKIKSKLDTLVESKQGTQILVILFIILVGLGCFELGRLSLKDQSSPIKIEYNGETQSANVLQAISTAKLLASPNISPTESGQNFFASSRGTKYYPAGCSAGKTIKQENRVYFDTRELAEKAGYILSSSCK